MKTFLMVVGAAIAGELIYALFKAGIKRIIQSLATKIYSRENIIRQIEKVCKKKGVPVPTELESRTIKALIEIHKALVRGTYWRDAESVRQVANRR